VGAVNRHTFGQGLSPRETQIVRLVAEGLDNAAIGTRLGISQNTAATHIHAASVKLGARNKTHLAVLAVKAGHVDLDGVHPRGISGQAGTDTMKLTCLLLPLLARWAEQGAPDSIAWMRAQISNAVRDL
jgi:DNA-binding CsgD family transcriptional regulator